MKHDHPHVHRNFVSYSLMAVFVVVVISAIAQLAGRPDPAMLHVLLLVCLSVLAICVILFVYALVKRRRENGNLPNHEDR